MSGLLLAATAHPHPVAAQAPTVTDRTPARNAPAAAAGGPVNVTFSVPVSAATAGNLRVFGNQRQGQRVGTVSGGGMAGLSFQPAQAFAPGEQVSVTVPATVQGTNGAAARPEVYQFRAAAGAGPADFAGGPTLPVPGPTASLVAGDVDGDGDLDLVTTGGTTVGIRLNDGTGGFNNAPDLTAPAGSALNGATLADVDADGRLDLLTSGNNFLDTWLNTGAGTFARTSRFAVSGLLMAPVAADLDADGDLDVLLADPGFRTVHVCLNAGTGTFGSGTDVPMGEYVYSVAVADLDADGDVDFVGAGAVNGNYTSGYANVRLNAGNATFGSAPDVTTGALSGAVALGDLDGDGDADLVVGNVIAPTNVLLNNGNGTFGSAPDVTSGSNTDAVALADVDGDGDLDLLQTVSQVNGIVLNLNDGTGRFAAGRLVRMGNGPFALAVADIDGDLALDLTAATASGTALTVRFNRLPAPAITGLAPSSGLVGSNVTITGIGFGTTTTVLFNGAAAGFVVNGSSNLVATVPPGATSGPVTVTTAGGTTVAAPGFSVTGPPAPVVVSRSPGRDLVGASPIGPVALTFSQAIAAPSAAELRVWGNRSGGRRPDAVGGGGTATLSLQPALPFRPGEVVQVSAPPSLLGTSGAAVRPEGYQFTAASGAGMATFVSGGDISSLPNPSLMQPGDLDDDGDLDFIAAVPTGLQVFTNNGRGTFSPGPMVASFARPQYGNSSASAMADVDNDGDLDFVTAGTYYRNNGSSFASIALPGLGSAGDVKAGDVDGDGDLDLLSFSVTTGEGLLVFNDGTGAFGPAAVLALGGTANQVELADVDGDGDLDAVATNRSDGTVTLCRNDGRGTFGQPAVVMVAPDPVNLKLADLDGDGDPDLVVANSFDPMGNTVSVRLNNGLGQFAGTGQVTAFANLSDLTLADLNGDNRPDIVLTAGPELRTSLNNGTGGFLPITQIPLASGSSLGLSVEDYNGDDALDIAVVGYNIGSNTPLLLLNQLPRPVVTSFTPTFGLPGTVVTVTGQYFVNVLNVALNGTSVTNLVINSPTSLTFTVPAGATTGGVYVYTDHGYNNNSPLFTVSNVPPDLDVIGPMDVAGIYRNVTVFQFFGTVANLVGPLTVTGTLTVRGGGTLLTNCQPITGPGAFVMEPFAQLTICDPAGISLSGPTGAVQVAGPRTFDNQGNYTYNGTQAQATGTGLPAQVARLTLDNPTGLALTQPLAITELLRLSRGDFSTNGQGLTLLSSFGGQAWVDNAGGAVLGTATVQRFVLAYRNAGLGYRHFSAPTTNATVGSLATAGFAPVVNPAYNTAPAPGLVTPFPTVYGYDQARSSTATSNFSDFDKGWVSPTGLTDPLVPGRGYSVNLSSGRTVAFTGPLNNGPLVLPLARAATPVADGGWQLLGNPYPSPLDWSRVTIPAGLEPALYYFRSTSAYGGTYTRYVNGIGNPVLDVGQGFFVRVAQPGTAVSLTLTNSARRVDTNPADFLRPTADARPRLRLRLTDAAGLADEATVYFEAGATTGFDAAFDARQLAANSGGEPSVWAVASSGEALGICGLPVGGAGTAHVPLGVALPRAGTFTFDAPTPANLTGLSAWLDDAATGRTARLDAGGTYAFSAGAGALTGRFTLRFGPAAPLGIAGGALAAGVSLYPNPARESLTVRVPAVPGVAGFAVELLNALGQSVARGTGPLPAGGGQLVLPLAGRAAGLYVVRVQVGGTTISRRVVVE
ncbi:FG-GAP-like repeat-containing protein [Hymenobacter sp.]|uniref:FG-GAP-like repeat-containing protein n=1 Tax=Hymenobacter sp. TaxID=1898978 RepID=UPI00286BAA41|nr:FG-GAP-like repeat-containing protein [Hymenobacter sp.]